MFQFLPLPTALYVTTIKKDIKGSYNFPITTLGYHEWFKIISAAVSPLPLPSALWRQQPLLAPWNTPVHWKREAHLSDGPKKNEILNRIRSFNQMEVKWLVSDKRTTHNIATYLGCKDLSHVVPHLKIAMRLTLFCRHGGLTMNSLQPHHHWMWHWTHEFGLPNGALKKKLMKITETKHELEKLSLAPPWMPILSLERVRLNLVRSCEIELQNDRR